MLDTAWVEDVLRRHQIAGVIHFAGDKAVGESVAQPLKYYRNNLCGAMSLMQAMEAAGCQTLVFSSSATVYGDPGQRARSPRTSRAATPIPMATPSW